MEPDCDNNFGDLQNIWLKFCSERDEQQKIQWAYLFLFKYHLYKNTTAENGALGILSSVPSQFSCYLLQLVYDIICASVASQNAENTIKENGFDDCDESKSSVADFQPSTLILKAPSDITAIVSLREFLTNGLGRAILEFLHGCETELITCKRELGSLLINLFPSSSWDNTNSEPFQPNVPMDLQKYFKNLSLMKNLDSLEQYCKIVKDIQWPPENDPHARFIYKTDEFEKFRDRRISSDQHAFFIIDILVQLVRAEAGQSLDEKSVTSESLQFALDTLAALHENKPFDPENQEIVKFKILTLTISCLNNMFAKEKNMELIVLNKLFTKVLQGLSANLPNCEDLTIKDYQVSSSLVMVYNIFALLYNLNTINRGSREEFLSSAVQVLNEENTKIFLKDLQSILENLSLNRTYDFKEIIDIMLLTVHASRSVNGGSRTGSIKRRVTSKTRKKPYRNQMHCKGVILPCMLENLLIKLFNLLDYRLQSIVIAYFEKNCICCCNFSIENIKLVMTGSQICEMEKYLYRFLRRRIIRNLFSNDDCVQCKETISSPDFHVELLSLYIAKYQSITRENDLIYLLKHLLKITTVVSNKVSQGILTTIALPIFYEEMNKETRSQKNIQTILLCLRIFRNCLAYPRLIKIFFIDETLQYLKALIFIPELVQSVCDLINIGLNDRNCTDMETSEQTYLFNELNSLLSSANFHCSTILDAVFTKVSNNNFSKSLSSAVPQANFDVNSNLFDLLKNGKLNISQLLSLTDTYWDLTLELCFWNRRFKTEFYQNFPLFMPVDCGSSTNEKCTNTLSQFVCNTIGCFLNHGRKSAQLLTTSTTLPESGLTESSVTNKTTTTLSDFCVISLESSFNEDTLSLSTTLKPNTVFEFADYESDLSTALESLLSSSSDGIDRRNALLGNSDNSLDYPNFEEVTNLMFREDHFHNELVSRFKECDSGEIIFDIKNQSRVNGVNKCCEKAFLTSKDERKTEERYGFVSSLLTLNSMLASSVSFLFGSVDEERKENSEVVRSSLYYDLEFLTEDKIRPLLTASSCRKKLLRMFTSALATLVLDQSQSKQRNMQLLLRQLRYLLLPCSKQLWDDVDNANALVQVLHALLKVAEVTGINTDEISSEQLPPKFAKSCSTNSQDTPLNLLRNEIPQADVKASADNSELNDSEVDNSDDDYFTVIGTDEGYEADAEVLELCDSSQDEKQIFRGYSPSSPYRAHIVHEGLCNLVVEILMELTVQCIKKPDGWVTSLTQLAKQLYTARESLGGTLFLIKGFSKILSQNDSRLKDLQQSILDLISDLRDPDCFAAYLNILAAENPPIEILLQHMTLICHNSVDVTPYVAMKFPVPNNASVSYHGNNTICENIKQMRNLHEIHEVDSIFTRAPCFLPITNNGNAKSFSEDGFTISTWIQLHRNSDSIKQQRNCEETHIISFGTQQLIISVFVNEDCNLIVDFCHPTLDISTKRGKLDTKSSSPVRSQSPIKDINKRQGRLCQLRRKWKLETLANSVTPISPTGNKESISEGYTPRNVLQTTTQAIFHSFSIFNLLQSQSGHILHGARIQSNSLRLPENKWTHLCVVIQKQRKEIHLTIILDGTVSFPFKLPSSSNISTRKSLEMIAIGEMYPVDVSELCSDHEYVSYSLSTVLAFQRCLSTSVLAHLTALGPECSDIIYCQAGNNIPNYGLLNYNLPSTFDLDQLQDALKFLRYNLILSYSAYEPNYAVRFSHGETGPNVLGQRQDVILYTALFPSKIASLQNAAYICGGLSSLLILFAKTVELTSKPDIQANALNILLRVALTDSRLYTEFVKKDTLNLIGSVIKTNQCSKSLHLLKVILNNACNTQVCVFRNGEIQLAVTIDACVIYPNLLVNIIKRYSDWSNIESRDSNVLDMLLECIQDLVREKQIHQSYNMSQFVKCGLVKELLNLCKIYLVESPNPVFFSRTSATFFVNILNIFAGAPPPPSLLDEITKLLLILQKPNECYVTDNRSRFYFLITSDIPTRQRRIGIQITSKNLRLSIRGRKISLGPSEGQFQSRGELKLTKCEHLMTRRLNKNRYNKITSLVYDLETLQSIASCSGISERKLCAVSREHHERFRKFLLELKKKQISQSQFQKNQMKKIVKKRCGKISKTVANDSSQRARRHSAGAEDEITAVKEFDIIHSDEISSLEETQTGTSKGFLKFTRMDVYQSPGVIAVQEGLFNLLRDFLLMLPDSFIEEVLTHYVKLEIILVLANHRNCNVRTSLLRLTMVFCERLTPAELQAVTKKMYWHHLANQLALHPVDGELIETCIQWITRKPDFSIVFEDITRQKLQIENKIGLNALFAMSMQTVHHTNLATNVFKVIEYLYQTDSAHQICMIENGLIQSVVKALHKIYLEVKTDYRIIEDNIRDLLTTIAEKIACSNGHITILWELLNILSYYTESNFTKVVYGFRSIQAHVMLSLLKMFVKENIDAGENIKLKEMRVSGSNLSASETRTRFELIIDRSMQFFHCISNSYHPSGVEITLFELLIALSLSGISRCSNLIAWGLSPLRILTFRACVTSILHLLIEQNNGLSTLMCDWKMVKAFLWKYQSMTGINGECSAINKVCTKLSVTENDGWNLEESLDKLEVNRTNCVEEQKPIIERVVYKFESQAQACTDTAMTITRIVADLQNSERKHLMNLMRQYDESFIYAEWKLIIQRMTHEGAPWHCSNQYPKSWELDDTEGPSRIRARLRRCALDIDPKFIMTDIRESFLENRLNTYPLKYLISSHDQQINFSLNAQILFNFPAKFLPVDGEIDGELIVTDEKIFFAATHRYRFFYINSFIDNITEIWIRRYQHQENAFEFFINSNKSFFFVVNSFEDRNMLKEIFADKIVTNVDPMKLMLQWKEGRLTNWEYLMILNQLAGRTYNDLMQYPVFPWILADYKSDCLDLTQKSSYRRLERPIAVQREESEQHYINNYSYMSSSMTNLGTWQMKPYHYSSHYSNSGTVLHFLVRVPPFTSFFLRYQDNNFDIPDRTFHSLNTTWNLASKDSPTDVKELIPEFFCLPEMFENFECFNFGARQNGEIVNHVTLPPWCSNNSRLFVLIHRQALESEMVRKNLHHWIDLIFGYKQSGQPAVDAINVFHPATYAEFDFENITDPIERQAFQTMIKTYGQMPRQLFKVSHETSTELIYSPHQPSVLTSIKGLRWGIFTGSPQLEDPKICSVYKQLNFPYTKVIPFETKNIVYGFSDRSCVMLGTDSEYNLVSWYHDDSIVRIHPLNENLQSAKPLLHDDPADAISCCGSHCGSNVLWFGHKSGKITVYHCTNHDMGRNNRNRPTNTGIKLSYNSAFRKITSKLPSRLEEYESLKDNKVCKYDLGTVHWSGPTVLTRHTDEVTGICVSTEFKIVVSIARDGLAVIWDLNSLNHVRSIDRPSEIRHSPLNIVVISPTLGDIFTVHSIDTSENESNRPSVIEEECFEVTEENLDDFVNVSMNFNGMSIMRLHSVNGKYVSHNIQEERILSACYSYIKEGVGVNVIATGFEGGTIKLWSSWDLSLIREIIVSQSDVIGITFSTYQHLVVLTKDYIQVWDSAGLLGDIPKFPQLMLHKGTNA